MNLNRAILSLILFFSVHLTAIPVVFGIETLRLPKETELSFTNPFRSFLPQKEEPEKTKKEEPEPKPQPRVESKPTRPQPPPRMIEAKPAQAPQKPVTPPELTISGVIWNSDRPQAIINDQVVGVGDVINGSQITKIDKTGVEVIFEGAPFTIGYN